MDSWKCGSWISVKDSPGSNSKDQELEGEWDQKSVTVNLALELGVPHVHKVGMGEDQHQDGTEESQKGEEGSDELTGVSLTCEPPPMLEIMTQTSGQTMMVPVIETNAKIWHSSRHCGVVCPVFCEHLDLNINWWVVVTSDTLNQCFIIENLR